jgi:hypothetical protein
MRSLVGEATMTIRTLFVPLAAGLLAAAPAGAQDALQGKLPGKLINNPRIA